MCIVCGNMEHKGLELLEKATLIAFKKKNKKEIPRFKALSNLEDEFKDDFAVTTGEMIKEIIQTAKKL